jgi:hypothetical protein
VSYEIVGGFVLRRCRAARAVRIYEVAGEALGEQRGVCAHEPRRQPRATDEGEKWFPATSDDLVGRDPPIRECYFHALTLPSQGA